MGLLLTAVCVNSLSADRLRAETTRNTPTVQAIRKAEPAVVNIQGNKMVTNASASGQSSKQEVNGMGTGVIIDRRGYIITNYHVVVEVSRIEVTLADGTTARAELINYDPETDLALIKIPTNHDLPVIQVGRSEDLLRGETVIAIGNPFGYQNTVTVGIISALHRDIPVNGTQQYNNLIQTNADINPGNSGGPLLNINGDVIGINVAVRVGAQGIGFAIPIDTALEVMADLVAAHREACTHGLTFSRDTDETGNQLSVIAAKGSRSNSVSDIKIGDRIASVEGQFVRNRLELELALLDKHEGDSVELGLQRKGVVLAHSITLSGGKSNIDAETIRSAWEQLGVKLSIASASSLASANGGYKGGLRISEVRSGSSAYKAGLVPGDIIVGVMDWQTPELKHLAWILENPNFRSSGTAKYYLVRKRSPMTVDMGLDSSALPSGSKFSSRNGIKDVR